MPSPAHDESLPESRLDQLLAEYLRRRDTDEAFDRRAFLAAHADLAEELKELLDTADLVERMAGPRDNEATPAGAPTLPAASPRPTAWEETTLVNRAAPSVVDRTIGTEEQAIDPSSYAKESQGEGEGPFEFGDYELLETLGRGGMGVVYKARQISLDRIVALKMILAGQFASESDIGRFYVEAHAAGKLTHPHIVNVYEVGEVGGRRYFTMEYVEGRSLAAEVDGKPLPPERAARYLELIARAVQFAHDQGVLHRDLKPANVIVDERDEPQVTDFGLAKDLSREDGLTASGATLGTPGYMAPEQAAGRRAEIGPAADVYSLGAILYEMLTGRPPFSGDSVVDVILDVIHKDPLPPRAVNRRVDRQLESVCLKCLQKDPAARYASAQEVADEMRRFLEGRPVRARRLGAVRRAALWVRDVPLVSAMLGRRVYAPSRWQVRVQWLAITALVFVAAFVAAWLARETPLPPQVRIAAGGSGGVYYRVGQALAEELENKLAPRPVLVLQTSGSQQNRSMLEKGESELAFLQSDALTSANLAVVAPLYYEIVLVIVREDRGIQSLADLRGKSIGLGPEGSGTRNTAQAILRAYEIDATSISRSQASYADLLTDPELDGAFVIMRLDNDLLRQLLTRPGLAPVAIDRAVEIAEIEASLKATRIAARNAPEWLTGRLPPEGLQTLETPAFLATRRDASPRLVRIVLKTIYHETDLVGRERLLPLEHAARWPPPLLHPAAVEFFQKPEVGQSAPKTDDHP